MLLTYALLIVWAVLLFGGFIFGQNDPNRRIPILNRMASSATLVFIALLLWRANPSPYTLWITVGMALGFLGDLFMAELIFKGDAHVLAGMGAFGLGHIAYIWAAFRFASTNGLTQPQLWVSGLLLWLFLGGVGWYLAVWRPATPENRSPLHRAALPYALLLAGTAGVGTALGLHLTPFLLFAIGAALFLFSDLSIALDLFNGIRFWQHGDLIWLTYGPGQMLIVITATLLT
jgi:hypothetical protein